MLRLGGSAERMLSAFVASLTLLMLCCFSASHARADDDESDWDTILLLEPEAPEAKPSGRRKGSRQKARRGKGGSETAQRNWHREDPADFALHEGHALPPLVIHVVGQPVPYVIDAQTDEGGFDEAARAKADEAFGSYEGGPSLHPRLLDLIYRATRHFGAASIHLVSGIRRDRQASRHSHGMAADIVLPGVKDEDLAAYFREQGFTGVGTYPRSGFVHIDVREASYFWVDRSPPNKRWKVVQVRAGESKAADEAALARGETPTLDPQALQQALSSRGKRRSKGKGKKKRG